MTKYYLGNETRYINKYGASITAAELKASEDNARKAGFRDRMAGYYDKWYRYNHHDNGAAYDEGVRLACQNPKCPADVYIIEVIEAAI